MDLKEIGYEDERWMELAQEHVKWSAFLLPALNLWYVLPENL
jgi:hypothetical protein